MLMLGWPQVGATLAWPQAGVMLAWLQAGAMLAWPQVGAIQLPHIESNLCMRPNKQRLLAMGPQDATVMIL